MWFVLKLEMYLDKAKGESQKSRSIFRRSLLYDLSAIICFC